MASTDAMNFIFGTGPKLVIGTIACDVSISESHESEMDVTENPVEDGVAITDHVQPKPFRITIEGIHSDTPMSFLNGLQPSLDLFGTSLAPTRAKDAYEAILDLQQSRTPFTLATGLTTYDNVVIESLKVPRDAQTGRAFRFSATIREIVTVETETLAVSPKVLPKADVGKVTPKAPGAGAGSQGSTLLNIFNSAAKALGVSGL